MQILDEKRRLNTWALLLLFLALLAAVLVVTEVTGHAEQQQRTAHETDCYYVFSCTLYLNKSETERVASASSAVAAAMIICNKATWLAALGCTVTGAVWMGAAISAKSQGKCLRIAWDLLPIPGPVTGYPRSYRCPESITGGTGPFSPSTSNGGGGSGAGAR